MRPVGFPWRTTSADEAVIILGVLAGFHTGCGRDINRSVSAFIVNLALSSCALALGGIPERLEGAWSPLLAGLRVSQPTNVGRSDLVTTQRNVCEAIGHAPNHADRRRMRICSRWRFR
ncbi:hypothetical protein BV20DRAFT_968999 [Pilatotrama ljubarskyi]|nr:hypothetical protein BV20DRAFT_968999 [Pilatotrama ljubarskyi]